MSQAALYPEPILEPDLPIVDPHHHLWDRRRLWADAPPATHPFDRARRGMPLYLLDELLGDVQSGHKVVATVFVECGAMHRADGPEAYRRVGETEFVNGVAAMSASGIYGAIRACAGIVASADLTLGDAAAGVLEAHMAAAPARFRGVRDAGGYDADPAVLNGVGSGVPGRYVSDAFRAGFRHLAKLGLSFDAWLLEPQLPELIDLARGFPDTPIILDHLGTPLGLASYEGRRPERFPIWRDNIRALARSPNVTVKLGGLGMAFCNFPSFLAEPRAPSEQLAQEWRPYVETAIEAFGPDRCMFESNFPIDAGCGAYATVWNAFKRLAANASDAEKTALFSGTARRVYRLEA